MALSKLVESYKFLLERERAGTSFTVSDLSVKTGWKPATIRTYLRKKWTRFVLEADGGLRVERLSQYTEDEYVRLMSQKDEISAEPKRPPLASEVEALVRKARESALLALHVYNSPATVFRTEGFSVLMVIAWTSLFHAIFEQRGEPYFYVEPDGSFRQVDGDKKAWELQTCMRHFWGDADHATRQNLDFFIRLRNRIEHRYVPAIDPHVAGECQALLLNFDEMLVEQFGTYFAIRESLAVPLQTANVRTDEQGDALRRLQSKHFDEVKAFVDFYRKSLPSAVYDSQKFALRVYLVPKTGNHKTSSDLAFEFVKFDPDHPEEMAEVHRQIALVKEKHVQVTNADLLRPSDVCAEVAARLGKEFKQHHHRLAWLYYGVRKSGFEPAACNTAYCVADVRHKDHSYTPAWVEVLVSKLSDAAEYDAVLASKKTGATRPLPRRTGP